MFTKSKIPPWPCPACNLSALKLVKDSYQEHETPTSKAARQSQHEDWSEEFFQANFCCFLKCDVCGEAMSACGATVVELVYDDEGPIGYEAFLKPRSLDAAPPIIYLPAKTTKELTKALKSSFGLFWTDGESCANKIRCGVEILMTAQGMLRFTFSNPKTGTPKRVPLPLHQRIVAFRKINCELADALLAVKWIGNTGSHDSQVHRNDLLDAYDMLSHVLDELYEPRGKRIGKLARVIIKRKKGRWGKSNRQT